MHRRTRRTLLIVAAVLASLAVAVFLRSKAPPEAARLLPESDGILFLDLKPVRIFAHKNLKPPKPDPEYQQFMDATGIDWEQDLDQVAIAMHRMDNPNGPNGPVAYSMVLEGRVTGNKLNSWLEGNAGSREEYGGKTIYNFPSQGRIVRVAQIGYDMLAISNTPTPEQIHSIIDRHRSAALPFSGSSLLERHYKDVPLLSVAWGVGQIGLPFNESGSISIFGFQLPLPADATIVASLAPVLPVPGKMGALRVKVEEFAPNPTEAASQASSLNSLVTLARGFTAPLGDNNANNALKEVLKDATVTQHHERVVVTATLSAGFLASLAQ